MRNKKIKLKLIIIFALIVIFSFKTEFILITKATENRSYKVIIQKLLTTEDDNLASMSDWLFNYSRYSDYDTLKGMRDDISNDIQDNIQDVEEYIRQIVLEIADTDGDSLVCDYITPDQVKNYLDYIVKEKERVKFYDEVWDYAMNISILDYSEEKKELLENKKIMIMQDPNYNEFYYIEYYRNARETIGRTFETKITANTQSDQTEGEAMIDFLDRRIRGMESNRLNIPIGESVDVPISINTDLYDPSNNPINSEDWSLAKNKVGYVLGAIRNVSIVIAVISLMIIGVKYILGSVEEKANYKQTLWPYFIGILLVTSGTVIVSAIYNAIN